MKLNLRESDLLGVGNERLCFVHPDVEERCVKVNKPGVVHRSQNKIEKYYFEKLKRKKVPFYHIPEYYGDVDTDYGPGLVFERVRDFDGHPSIRLDHAFKCKKISENDIIRIMSDLFLFFYKYGIYLGDINSDQILIKKDRDKITPIVIDGLGTRRYGLKLIIISNFTVLARRKLVKKWRKLEYELGVL
ncbi:YrbL family protein [Salinivibrio socompensis]|uniref:YrbL family protein n=2 Tax=Salinivibrio socompensis TaxID=1510206 RepID=UPI0004728639|nr:YrbL family protein [Salinivibrio socompensis]